MAMGYEDHYDAPDGSSGADEQTLRDGDPSFCADKSAPSSPILPTPSTAVPEEGVETSNSQNAHLNSSKKQHKRRVLQNNEVALSVSVKDLAYSALNKLKESIVSVLPIVAIVIALSVTPLVGASMGEILTFAASAMCLIIGVALFNLGADLAMTPMGEHTGSGLAKSKSLPLLLAVTFIMGLLITIAEPDLSVLAEQVSGVMDKTLLIAVVGIGVGAFLLVGVLRIVFKKNLAPILMFFYLLLFALATVMLERGKGGLLPLAFDAGGVTTGPITVPFIMALGVGVAVTTSGSSSKENSFGLIALASIGPMLAVALLSLFSKGDMAYTMPDYSVSDNIAEALKANLSSNAADVAIALGLIILFFVILQIFVLKLPGRKLLKIAVGIIYAFLGLLIFFTSARIGFMPLGFKVGEALAMSSKPALIVFGFAIGFVAVLAEPAIHVLIKQVEHVTGGAVSKISMLIALSVGTGLSIGLSVIRVIFGFSLLYYLIPGYILSLGLTFFVPKIYSAIAFDAGGVASGPMTASFLLPMLIGACAALNGAESVLDMAFGVVAMVAMTPLITIQLLGFRAIMKRKVKDKMIMRRIVEADDEQIIEF